MRQHDELSALPHLLTLRSAAALLRVSPIALAGAVLAGQVPVRLAAGRLRIPTAELLLGFGLQSRAWGGSA